MAQDSDEDRIRHKAHELWEAEGRPHGRDAAHWEQAREIIAIQDSHASALLPRDSGAEEPVESSSLRAAYGDVPGLTDQGEHALTDVSREPGAASAQTTAPVTSEEIEATAKRHPKDVAGVSQPAVSGKKASVKPPPVRVAAKSSGKPDPSSTIGKPAAGKLK